MTRNPRRLALGLGFLLAAGGCGLDKPVAPSFDTEVNIPTGSLRYTVADLIKSQHVVQGDTTADNAVSLAYDGVIDSIQVGDRLSADVPMRTVSGVLGDRTANLPASLEHSFTLSDVSGIPVPPGGANMVIPAFPFIPVSSDLPVMNGFTAGTIRTGVLTLIVHNNLPVAIQQIDAEIHDVVQGTTLGHFQYASAIPPGGQATASVSLAGITISNRFWVGLMSGNCPGSGGPVDVQDTDAIRLEARLDNFAFDTLTAPVDSIHVVSADSTSLTADIQVEQAAIASLTLPIRLTSTVPLPVTLVVTFPEIRVNGQPWTRQYNLAAGSPTSPASLNANEMLTGAQLVQPNPGPNEAIHYRIDVHSGGSGGQAVTLRSDMAASAQIGPFHLDFDSVTAVFESKDLAVTPTETRFELPAGTDALTFLDADLQLDVVNGIQVPGVLHLNATGSKGGHTVAVALQGAIPAAGPSGSTTTHLHWDQGNSNVLDLMNLRPDMVTISGSVTVGDGVTSGTVRRTDEIVGRYHIAAPLRVRVKTTTFRPDSFTVTLDRDIQERIRKNNPQGGADLTVENHIPVGVSLRLIFADAADRLRNPPDGLHVIALDSVSVAAPDVDAVTGRVTQSRTASVTFAMDSLQVKFFGDSLRSVIYGAAEVKMLSPGATPIELRTTDYVAAAGILRMRLRVEK